MSRKVTFLLYELDNYGFVSSDIFEAFTDTTFLGVSIDKDFLYNRFLDKYGSLNINEEIPTYWTNKLTRHLEIELPILNKKIEAFTNSISSVENFKQVESTTKSYNYEKQPINLDVEGNEDFYNTANMTNTISPTNTDFEAYNTLKNSYYNLINEFIEELGEWFLCLMWKQTFLIYQ